MSKAEELADKLYPKKEHVAFGPLPCEEPSVFDDNKPYRIGFIEGYHQAEKDLELGWRDIRIILDIENDILCECNSQKELVIETYPKGEDYYGEILKRFKERKGE